MPQYRPYPSYTNLFASPVPGSTAGSLFNLLVLRSTAGSLHSQPILRTSTTSSKRAHSPKIITRKPKIAKVSAKEIESSDIAEEGEDKEDGGQIDTDWSSRG